MIINKLGGGTVEKGDKTEIVVHFYIVFCTILE